MREIYVISDTHFGHSKFLTFMEGSHPIRDFSCVEEMDELMVERWNATVGPQDIVYHLGDVYFNDGCKHLSRLNGRKRLVLGNHDNGKSEHLQKNFQKIMVSRQFREYGCILTHHPIHLSGMEKYSRNIHGHIHQNSSPTSAHSNVSVEKIDYTPVRIQDITLDIG